MWRTDNDIAFQSLRIMSLFAYSAIVATLFPFSPCYFQLLLIVVLHRIFSLRSCCTFNSAKKENVIRIWTKLSNRPFCLSVPHAKTTSKLTKRRNRWKVAATAITTCYQTLFVICGTFIWKNASILPKECNKKENATHGTTKLKKITNWIDLRQLCISFYQKQIKPERCFRTTFKRLNDLTLCEILFYLFSHVSIDVGNSIR